MKNVYITLCIILSACGSAPKQESNLKRVFVIGDSISLGYTPFVKTKLDGIATVQHNEGNARNSSWTNAYLDQWLAQVGQQDVITWNNGMWDCIGSTGWFYGTSQGIYEQNLKDVAQRLVATGAKIIYFTTTEIPTGQINFTPGCELSKNASAQAVLPGLGVTVKDLYTDSLAYTDLHVDFNLLSNVHWTDAGSDRLSDFVVSAINQALSN